MMAIDADAKELIIWETIKYILKIAKRIIQKNGYEDQIRFIKNKPTYLFISKQIIKKADVIISEILFPEFVDEGVQTSILDAKKRVLKKNGKIIYKADAIK